MIIEKDEIQIGRENYVFQEIAYQSNEYSSGANTKGDDKSPLMHVAEREGLPAVILGEVSNQ